MTNLLKNLPTKSWIDGQTDKMNYRVASLLKIYMPTSPCMDSRCVMYAVKKLKFQYHQKLGEERES